MVLLVLARGRIIFGSAAIAAIPAISEMTDIRQECPGPNNKSELRPCNATAQTRIVSVARIRLQSRKSARSFKGVICDDSSEFESHMASHPVWSLWAMSGL